MVPVLLPWYNQSVKGKNPVKDNYFACYSGAENASLYVTTMGTACVTPNSPYPVAPEDYPEKYTMNWTAGRVLDEFQFVYISEGSGKLRSFEGDFPLKAGSLVCLVPGEKHRYAPEAKTGWLEYWIGFSGSAPMEWMEQGLLEKTITVHQINNQREMLVPFLEALDFAKSRTPAVQPLIASCVMRILGRLTEDQNTRSAMANYDIIEQSKKIFEQNIYYPMDMEELTRSLNINYQILRDKFREKTGLSPYQYFLLLKINKAKELLQEGTLSIKEISYKLSFDSPYYFSRLFKKKTGVSPSQWNNTTSPQDLDLWEA